MKITPAALVALVSGLENEKDGLENFRAAVTPGGIERQEAEGQRIFVASEVLPIDCPQSELEALGFKFGEPVDDLFVAVQFPDGWKKKATDHSMWSELIDPEGKVRASIFYKAAFYDRKAHMSLDK